MSKRQASIMPDVASLLQHALVGLVDRSRRHAWFVVIAGILLAGASGLYASRHLGINTDTDQMFAASLPWRQHAMALEPRLSAIAGPAGRGDRRRTPEEAEATAQGLAQALSDDHTHFTEVRRPDASPYLRKEGLLLLPRAAAYRPAQPDHRCAAVPGQARGRSHRARPVLGAVAARAGRDARRCRPYALSRAVAGVPRRDGGRDRRPSAAAVLATPAERQGGRSGRPVPIRPGAAQAGFQLAAAWRRGDAGDTRGGGEA